MADVALFLAILTGVPKTLNSSNAVHTTSTSHEQIQTQTQTQNYSTTARYVRVTFTQPKQDIGQLLGILRLLEAGIFTVLVQWAAERQLIVLLLSILV
jgi:hypothetical protein